VRMYVCVYVRMYILCMPAVVTGEV